MENSKYYKKENILSSLNVLLEPVKLRFIYNFSGSRDTNNSARPEWFLEYVNKVIENHENFMNIFIQPYYKENNIDIFV